MDRQELEARLVEYVYDELGPAQRAAFEEALGRFPALAAEVRAHAHTRALFARLADEDERAPQAALYAATREARQALAVEEAAPWWTRAVAWLTGRLTHPGVAAALLLVAVAVTGLRVLRDGEAPARFERVMAPPSGGGLAPAAPAVTEEVVTEVPRSSVEAARAASEAPGARGGGEEPRAADRLGEAPSPVVRGLAGSAGGAGAATGAAGDGAVDEDQGGSRRGATATPAANGAPPHEPRDTPRAKRQAAPRAVAPSREARGGGSHGSGGGGARPVAKRSWESGSAGAAPKAPASPSPSQEDTATLDVARDEQRPAPTGGASLAALRGADAPTPAPAATPAPAPAKGRDAAGGGQAPAPNKKKIRVQGKLEAEAKDAPSARAKFRRRHEEADKERTGQRADDGARIFARYRRELAAGRTAAAEALLVVLERVPAWRARARAERKRLKAQREAAKRAAEARERAGRGAAKTPGKKARSRSPKADRSRDAGATEPSPDAPAKATPASKP